uniref:Serpentine receptor class gamma n=1 Tax=Panagrolaimus sp. PS1159 TaxID=55785 RepID=A0AC35EX38_9BILA
MVILVALVTTYCSTIAILFGEYARTLHTMNFINSYIVQTIRTFFFIVALERITATVYIEKYKLSHKFWWFWILTIFTIIFSVVLVSIVLNVFEGSILTFLLYRYTTLTMHMTSISVTAILYTLNQRLYKITAYRISLKKRYQVFSCFYGP